MIKNHVIFKYIKNRAYNNKCLFRLLRVVELFFRVLFRVVDSRSNKYVNKSLYSSISKEIIGKDNFVFIGEKSRIYGLRVVINGIGNQLIIGENCVIGKNCYFLIEGSGNKILIESNCTFTHSVHLCAQEYDTSILIGEDCMFSNNIIVRTSDSHPIYNNTGKRINNAKSVEIGKHVWIAPHATVMKGVHLGEGVICASNSVITKDIKKGSLVGGIPAKIIKENISWSRKKIF